MNSVQIQAHWVKLYLSGPIEVAKQIIREECISAGLCVTIEPTTYIYTGGEEQGYVVGLINYPRFPSTLEAIDARGRELMERLMLATFQGSALMMTPHTSVWISTRTP
jgi:ferredoxin